MTRMMWSEIGYVSEVGGQKGGGGTEREEGERLGGDEGMNTCGLKKL